MLNSTLQFLVFLITILLLVTVHEWGHFLVARCLGVKVLRFSVGFGKPVWRRVSRSGVEFVIAWLPLGGYVKLLDEREGIVPDEDKHLAFNRQPLWIRSLIVLAGPGINILFAILAFWIMWLIGVPQVNPIISQIEPNSIAASSGMSANEKLVSVDGKPVETWGQSIMLLIRRVGDTNELTLGTITNTATSTPHVYSLPLINWKIDHLQPDLLKSLGIVPYTPPLEPVIGKIQEGSPASKSDLKVGDRILALNGKPFSDWQEGTKYIQKLPNQKIQMTVQRQNQVLELQVETGRKLRKLQWVGFLGVEPPNSEWPSDMRYVKRYDLGNAFMRALSDTWSFTAFNFIIFKKLVMGEISLLTLGGPISIFQTTGIALAQGIVIFIGFVGLISIMLACVNILPIPGLDGGHLLFFLIEKITARPISVPVQVLVFRLGLVALMLLAVQASVNDVMRIFS